MSDPATEAALDQLAGEDFCSESGCMKCEAVFRRALAAYESTAQARIERLEALMEWMENMDPQLVDDAIAALKGDTE